MRGSRGGDGDAPRLPPAVPVDVPHLSRLSWELGTRVVEDEEAVLHSEWERDDAIWALSVVEVTSATVVLRVRSPLEKEQFYGAAQMDLESVLPELEEATDWRRVT
ncbi:hypothetical protein ACFPYI_09750 [Halomarina salina]|uniref:Uncharacterized protein n=1 Tax=Halomarina salina TaxID=1872699 RepID=A0ABD5RN01_9EURY|nr:hypothetical protein [Halomarina salina]